jgi:hypothetical protein
VAEGVSQFTICGLAVCWSLRTPVPASTAVPRTLGVMLSGLDQPLQLGDATVDDLHPLFGQVPIVRANPGTETCSWESGGSGQPTSLHHDDALDGSGARPTLQLDPPSLDEQLARARLRDTSAGA